MRVRPPPSELGTWPQPASPARSDVPVPGHRRLNWRHGRSQPLPLSRPRPPPCRPYSFTVTVDAHGCVTLSNHSRFGLTVNGQHVSGDRTTTIMPGSTIAFPNHAKLLNGDALPAYTLVQSADGEGGGADDDAKTPRPSNGNAALQEPCGDDSDELEEAAFLSALPTRPPMSSAAILQPGWLHSGSGARAPLPVRAAAAPLSDDDELPDAFFLWTREDKMAWRNRRSPLAPNAWRQPSRAGSIGGPDRAGRLLVGRAPRRLSDAQEAALAKLTAPWHVHLQRLLWSLGASPEQYTLREHQFEGACADACHSNWRVRRCLPSKRCHDAERPAPRSHSDRVHGQALLRRDTVTVADLRSHGARNHPVTPQAA